MSTGASQFIRALIAQHRKKSEKTGDARMDMFSGSPEAKPYVGCFMRDQGTEQFYTLIEFQGNPAKCDKRGFIDTGGEILLPGDVLILDPFNKFLPTARVEIRYLKFYRLMPDEFMEELRDMKEKGVMP